MADAPALGAGGGNPMEVQVLSPAPFGFAGARTERRRSGLRRNGAELFVNTHNFI